MGRLKRNRGEKRMREYGEGQGGSRGGKEAIELTIETYGIVSI